MASHRPLFGAISNVLSSEKPLDPEGVAVEGKVLELVVYKLKGRVSDKQFLSTNGAVSTWISKQPGFI
jgi:hypothetical protein